MAKVYDALRRAEEERKRRATGGESPVAPLGAPAAAAPPTAVFADLEARPLPAARRPPLWRRLLPKRRAPVEAAVEGNKRRITLLQPESFVAEQFRTLRGRIDAIAAKQPVRSLAVTSPNAGDGKTTAAINLATVTALSLGRRVLLVDCDLRKPKVHLALGQIGRASCRERVFGLV